MTDDNDQLSLDETWRRCVAMWRWIACQPLAFAKKLESLYRRYRKERRQRCS